MISLLPTNGDSSNSFASPMRKGCIDYRRFSEVVEESFTQACLERAPLVVPMQHIPTKDCERNFLNFDERLCLSIAIQKLSKKPDLQMNLMSVFKVKQIMLTYNIIIRRASITLSCA